MSPPPLFFSLSFLTPSRRSPCLPLSFCFSPCRPLGFFPPPLPPGFHPLPSLLLAPLPLGRLQQLSSPRVTAAARTRGRTGPRAPRGAPPSVPRPPGSQGHPPPRASRPRPARPPPRARARRGCESCPPPPEQPPLARGARAQRSSAAGARWVARAGCALLPQAVSPGLSPAPAPRQPRGPSPAGHPRPQRR